MSETGRNDDIDTLNDEDTAGDIGETDIDTLEGADGCDSLRLLGDIDDTRSSGITDCDGERDTGTDAEMPWLVYDTTPLLIGETGTDGGTLPDIPDCGVCVVFTLRPVAEIMASISRRYLSLPTSIGLTAPLASTPIVIDLVAICCCGEYVVSWPIFENEYVEPYCPNGVGGSGSNPVGEITVTSILPPP